MNTVYFSSFYAVLEMCEWRTQLHVKLTTDGMIQCTCTVYKRKVLILRMELFTLRHKLYTCNSSFIIILLYNHQDIHGVYLYQY